MTPMLDLGPAARQMAGLLVGATDDQLSAPKAQGTSWFFTVEMWPAPADNRSTATRRRWTRRWSSCR